MGMFDTIFVHCPTCNERVEVQTKNGACLLEEYELANAPNSLLIQMDGEEESCSNGHSFKIKVQSIVHASVVPM